MSRRRLENSPRVEPLEDRRLLSYAIVDLGTLGGTISVAEALNDRGEVVGYSETSGDVLEHAFLYARGRMTDLGTLGGANSKALSINDRGAIVGISNVAPGSSQIDAFLERGGKLTDLGQESPDFYVGGMLSIDDAGAVAGLPAGRGDASVLRRGKRIDIGSLAGLGSAASDINDRGQIVGASPTAETPAANGSSPPTVIYHAFLEDHGAMTDLGTLGGQSSFAAFINDRGSVVGFSDTANDAASHAFVDTRGRMTDLGTLGGRYSSASAINNDGVVVGAAETSAGVSHGFIERRGRMVDLNSMIPASSGIVITNAADINDRGEIAAAGYAVSAPTVQLAFLLRPTGAAR